MQHRISAQLLTLLAFSICFATLPAAPIDLVSLSAAADNLPGTYFADPILSDGFSKFDTSDAPIFLDPMHRCTASELHRIFQGEAAIFTGTSARPRLLPNRPLIRTAPKQGPPDLPTRSA